MLSFTVVDVQGFGEGVKGNMWGAGKRIEDRIDRSGQFNLHCP